jgi:hypothetical protein
LFPNLKSSPGTLVRDWVMKLPFQPPNRFALLSSLPCTYFLYGRISLSYGTVEIPEVPWKCYNRV